MIIPIRRVVTRNGADGRSEVFIDGAATSVTENPNWPGRGVTHLWNTDTAPADLGVPTSPFAMLPTELGTTFLISQIPPESEIASMNVERRASLMHAASQAGAGMIRRDTTRHPGMHATNTLDYIMVLAGEITMLLDEGEVTLRPLDALVQRGTNHAWVNRGTETAILACVIVGARAESRAGGPSNTSLLP